MDWINYHHLLYFWLTAKEGGISAAAEKLHLAQPTVSAQIQKLERNLGVPLFERVGKTLQLTETGQVAFRYAEEIFSLGRELSDSLRGMPQKDSLRLTVGVPDVLPKLIVYQLLKPLLTLPMPVQLTCYEGKLADLLADLALHRLHLVLSDAPLTAALHIQAFNHLLGETHISVLGHRDLARKFKPQFPRSLHGAPMILPTPNTNLRRSFDQWCSEQDLRPQVLHEFEDSAVLKVFGQHGEGLFLAPTAIEAEIRRQYQVRALGQLPALKEQFFAITVERRLKHPAVVKLCQAARENLFASSEPPPK